MKAYSTALPLLTLTLLLPAGAAVVSVDPTQNNVPITSVTYSVDGLTVVQNTEAAAVSVNRDSPVFLQSVTINDGGVKQLGVFNSLGAEVKKLNFTTQTTGVQVFDNGVLTGTSNLATFSQKLAGITQDSDLLHYVTYDFPTNMPAGTTPDYDLVFNQGLSPSDYVLVSERWGNTFFSIVPLNSSGNVIAGANTLTFGGPGLDSPYQAYDWNSGYASSTFITDQAFGFTVASVGKFFQGTNVTPQPVFGFQINNDGEADVKFFGLSVVPEPSSLVLLGLGTLFMARRRR